MAAVIFFEYQGAERVASKLKGIGIDIEAQTQRNLAAAAVNIEGKAKVYAPVRQKPVKIRGALYSGGRLRQSIHKVIDYEGPLSVAVIASVDYAVPVHEGHKTRSGGKVAGRPFLQDAATEEQVRFMKRQEEIVRKAVGL